MILTVIFIKKYQTIPEGCFTIAELKLHSGKTLSLAKGEYLAQIKIGGRRSGTEQMKNRVDDWGTTWLRGLSGWTNGKND